MKTFESVTADLNRKQIPFEKVEFIDEAISARTTDTSKHGNYNPEYAIKTLIVSTKEGFKAVILRGSDRIEQPKLNAVIGKWKIADGETLKKEFGYNPGTICPLSLSLPFYIDEEALKLPVWSMGAGEVNKGINVKTEDALRALGDYQRIEARKL